MGSNPALGTKQQLGSKKFPGKMSYFGIGIAHGKTKDNVGTLWRSAYQLGASFIFTVGSRHPRMSSDTVGCYSQIPLLEYQNKDNLIIPYDCIPVAIEMGGEPIDGFQHPKRAMYFLGAEDHGLPKWALERCVKRISLPHVRLASFNVAVAGAIVMYDRLLKTQSNSHK